MIFNKENYAFMVLDEKLSKNCNVNVIGIYHLERLVVTVRLIHERLKFVAD